MNQPDATPTPITPPWVPLINQTTGQIEQAWYMFLLSLFRAVQTIEEQKVGPDANSGLASLQNILQQLAQQVNTLPSSTLEQTQPFLNDLSQRLGTLPSPATIDQIMQLATDVQALAVAPAQTPQLRQFRYGSFYDTTTQTAAAINTAYAMTFNTTDMSVGVYLGSPTSRVYVDRGSVYNIQFSAQLDNTSGGNHLAYIWLRVNGSDVTNSASEVRLKGNDGELVAAWNFLYSFNAGDYFELMWSVADTAVQLIAVGAAAPVPGIPSVILTVTDNISPYQF